MDKKLKILLTAALFSYLPIASAQTVDPAFATAMGNNVTNPIVAAINNFNASVKAYLFGSATNPLQTSLSKIIVNAISDGLAKVLFSADTLISEQTYALTSSKVFNTTKDSLANQQSQQIAHNYSSFEPNNSLDEKRALLNFPLETGLNVSFDSNSNPLGAITTQPNAKLSSGATLASKQLNIMSLLGPLTYTDDNSGNQTQDAQYFLALLDKFFAPPKMVYIPSVSKQDTYTIFLPFAKDSDPNQLEQITNISKDDLSKIQTKLKDKQFYIDYKMNNRGIMALRTLYMNEFFKNFAERQKNSEPGQKENKSLNEAEYDMATENLTNDYIAKLNKLDAVAVNKEVVFNLAKMNYLLYRVDQDLKRQNLLQSANGLLTLNTLAQLNEMNTKQLASWLRNQCYLPDNEDKPVCQGKPGSDVTANVGANTTSSGTK